MPPFPVDAVLKGDETERPGKLVTPGVIQAIYPVGAPAGLDAQHRAF